MSNKSYIGMLSSITADGKPVDVEPTSQVADIPHRYAVEQGPFGRVIKMQGTVPDMDGVPACPPGFRRLSNEFQHCLGGPIEFTFTDIENDKSIGQANPMMRLYDPSTYPKHTYDPVEVIRKLKAKRQHKPKANWANPLNGVDGEQFDDALDAACDEVWGEKGIPPEVDYYAQSFPFPRPSMEGNLPATMELVMAQDLCVTANQLQRDAIAFQRKCDCRASDMKIKVPNCMSVYARLAFSAPPEIPYGRGVEGSFAPIIVGSVLFSKSHADPNRQTEYWIEGGGVLCRILPAGTLIEMPGNPTFCYAPNGEVYSVRLDRDGEITRVPVTPEEREVAERLRLKRIADSVRCENAITIPAPPQPMKWQPAMVDGPSQSEWDAMGSEDRRQYVSEELTKRGHRVERPPKRRGWLRKIGGLFGACIPLYLIGMAVMAVVRESHYEKYPAAIPPTVTVGGVPQFGHFDPDTNTWTFGETKR